MTSIPSVINSTNATDTTSAVVAGLKKSAHIANSDCKGVSDATFLKFLNDATGAAGTSGSSAPVTPAPGVK